MNFPANLRYTKDHEWVSLEGDIATIGITDYAQKELGDIVYVAVDTVGKPLEAGAVFGTADSYKSVSDLFLPVSGVITELNPELTNAPELVNSDPYGKGWMIKMKVDNPSDVDKLLDAAAYEAVIAQGADAALINALLNPSVTYNENELVSLLSNVAKKLLPICMIIIPVDL